VNYATDVSPVIVDIETVGLPNAADYLEPPTPDSRLKDPDKVAADIQAKTEARNQKYGLDWNVGRIVAIGAWVDGSDIVTHICPNEAAEKRALELFWEVARRRTIITFNGRNFDLPFMAQRSRYLGIPHPTLDLRPYEGGRGNIDLWLELTFGRKETPCMRTTLGAFCKRFGIEHDDSISGKDIGALVAAGEWEKVEAHVKADVLATVALARRLRIIQQAPELVTF
jgi:DNA polymerase elongation subunit (family B)